MLGYDDNICFRTESAPPTFDTETLGLTLSPLLVREPAVAVWPRSRGCIWAAQERGGGCRGCSGRHLGPMHYGMWKCMGAGMLFTENNWLGTSPGQKVGAGRGRGRSREWMLIIEHSQTHITFGGKTKMDADHRSPDLKLPINKN